MKTLDIVKEIKVYIILIFILFCVVWFINNNYLEQLTSFDKNILEFANINMHTPFMTILMKAITFFGSVLAYVILLFLFILISKNVKLFFLLTLNVTFVFLLNFILKIIYMRERPESALINEIGSSLPSSHSMCSIAFYGLVIYFIQKYIKNVKIRYIFITFFAILILLIGFSRIYLNVHYMSDVIIGYLFGLLFVLIFIRIINVIEKGEV